MSNPRRRAALPNISLNRCYGTSTVPFGSMVSVQLALSRHERSDGLKLAPVTIMEEI